MDKITELMKSLIVNICNDLKKPNKSNEMIKKYIDGNDNKNNNNSKKIVKKPLSSYMIFCNETRNKIKNKYPKSSVGEISKKLGKLWKALNVKDREKYDKLYEKEKDRYRNELKKMSKTTTGLLSEKSLSMSYINNSDESKSEESLDELKSEEILSDLEEDKDIFNQDEESKSNETELSESEDLLRSDEDDEDDELGELCMKKKINLGDINNDMNSIYLDSD